MQWTYLLINLFTVIIPFVFSFHPKLNFYKNWRAFFTANSIVALLFIIWDIQFTKMGIWGFDPDYLCGLYLFNLPIEEVLFFFCIPYACVFTYHCLTLFFEFKWKKNTEKIFTILLSLFLIATGTFFYNRLYTSITFISLSSTLLVMRFGFNVKWLSKIYSVYAVLLIPFLIVNGILTGTMLQKPVVWYNNSHNLGIRIHTIPVEDVFYGFELILLIVLLHEFLLSRKKTQSFS
jgi:lycopene cyclase domain-containing protein